LSLHITLQPLQASAASIEKAWYLMLAEDSLSIDVSKLDVVIEIGGGYGQVASLLKSVGFQGRQIVLDSR
jgi:hypothetical protein